VLVATAFPFTLGAVMLLAVVLAQGGPVIPALSPAAGASVLGLGIACTALTFWLWNWGLLRAEAAKAGVFANLEPVIGAGLGVLILGEIVGPAALVGAGLVLSAALLVSTDR
jgi:drug/metabolite transporter (DMT)-like permease